MAVDSLWTSQNLRYAMPMRDRSATKYSSLDNFTYWYSVATLSGYCVRDALTAAARYYLDMFGLSPLWFIPDLMAFGSLGLFVVVTCIRDQNVIARLFMTAFTFALIMCMIFYKGEMVPIFSSVKMFIPMFAGLCFGGRSLFETKIARRLMLMIFVVSAIGIIVNPYIEYPWFGYATTNAFGMERQASKLWWAGGVVRYGGLAGDSTMAAFMVIFPYLMISPFHGILFNILCWPIIYLALDTSTSKTAIGVFAVYAAAYLVRVALPRASRLHFTRRLAMWSFIFILAPPVMMILLGGIDLGKISPWLNSIGDRINNTWGGPYVNIAEMFPIGLFTGCGLGCYSYPMLYSSWSSYFLPLDNFYLATVLMMGYPFLIFLIVLFLRVGKMQDQIKLTLLFIWNVYTVTVQAYGPSYATLIYGYTISELFTKPKRRSIKIIEPDLPNGPPGGISQASPASESVSALSDDRSFTAPPTSRP